MKITPVDSVVPLLQTVKQR